MIAYPVNNNGTFGGRAKHHATCAVVKDANGNLIANVVGSPERKNCEAVDLAFEICQALNAYAEMVRRCEECRANIPPHRRDVEIVDFIQYGREARR